MHEAEAAKPPDWGAELAYARRELIDERLREIELEGKRATTAAKLYFIYGAGATDPEAYAPGKISR